MGQLGYSSIQAIQVVVMVMVFALMKGWLDTSL